MVKENLLSILVLLLVIGCSGGSSNSYKYVEINTPFIPEKERYGYGILTPKVDTVENEIIAEDDTAAYAKALDLFLMSKAADKEATERTIRYNSPDTFYLYKNKSQKMVSVALPKSKIKEIAMEKQKQYDLDKCYEVYETLRFDPNSSGIRRGYAMVKIAPKYKDNLEQVLKKVHRMRGTKEYLIVFGYLETPPSFKEWVEKDMLDKDVNRMTAIYRKGKETAYAVFNIPASGGGFIE